VDDSRVSKIADKILPLIKEWQKRPLQNVCAMVILNAVHFSSFRLLKEGYDMKTDVLKWFILLLLCFVVSTFIH